MSIVNIYLKWFIIIWLKYAINYIHVLPFPHQIVLWYKLYSKGVLYQKIWGGGGKFMCVYNVKENLDSSVSPVRQESSERDK